VLTVKLNTKCFRGQDVVIIIKLVDAITMATFPNDERKLQAKQYALERSRSEATFAISKLSLSRRQELAASDPSKRLVLRPKEFERISRKYEKALLLASRKGTPKPDPIRSYTLRHPNRFTVERDVWGFLGSAIASGELRPFALDNRQQQLTLEDYHNGGLLFDKLVEWGRATGLHDFKRQANARATAVINTDPSAQPQALPAGVPPIDGSAKPYPRTLLYQEVVQIPEWQTTTNLRAILRDRAGKANSVIMEVSAKGIKWRPKVGGATTTSWAAFDKWMLRNSRT